jgi:hypothetical protein
MTDTPDSRVPPAAVCELPAHAIHNTGVTAHAMLGSAATPQASAAVAQGDPGVVQGSEQPADHTRPGIPPVVRLPCLCWLRRWAA